MKMQWPFTQLPPFWMQHCIGVWHVGGETHSFDWQTRPAAQPPQLMVPPQPFAMLPHTPDEQVRGTHAVVVSCTVDMLVWPPQLALTVTTPDSGGVDASTPR